MSRDLALSALLVVQLIDVLGDTLTETAYWPYSCSRFAFQTTSPHNGRSCAVRPIQRVLTGGHWGNYLHPNQLEEPYASEYVFFKLLYAVRRFCAGELLFLPSTGS